MAYYNSADSIHRFRTWRMDAGGLGRYNQNEASQSSIVYIAAFPYVVSKFSRSICGQTCLLQKLIYRVLLFLEENHPV